MNAHDTKIADEIRESWEAAKEPHPHIDCYIAFDVRDGVLTSLIVNAESKREEGKPRYGARTVIPIGGFMALPTGTAIPSLQGIQKRLVESVEARYTPPDE